MKPDTPYIKPTPNHCLYKRPKLLPLGGLITEMHVTVYDKAGTAQKTIEARAPICDMHANIIEIGTCIGADPRKFLASLCKDQWASHSMILHGAQWFEWVWAVTPSGAQVHAEMTESDHEEQIAARISVPIWPYRSFPGFPDQAMVGPCLPATIVSFFPRGKQGFSHQLFRLPQLGDLCCVPAPTRLKSAGLYALPIQR